MTSPSQFLCGIAASSALLFLLACTEAPAAGEEAAAGARRATANRDPDDVGRPRFFLQNQVERPEPFEDTVLRVNPPTFRWPEKSGAAEYELQFSRGADFREPTRATARDTFHRPIEPLPPGRWYWRHRPAGDAWSGAESFEVSADLPRWPIDDWGSLLSRIPAGRPRIFARPEDMTAHRARASGPMKDLVRHWAEQSRARIGEELVLREDPPPVPPGSQDTSLGRGRRIWDAKAVATGLVGPVRDLSWLWALTGERSFAEEARRRVLAAARMNPRKFCSDDTSDFANATVTAGVGFGYDMLHDQFFPGERAEIRAMLNARVAAILRRLRATPQGPFYAHGWQHVFIEGLIGALALHGEDPLAHEYVECAVRLFVAFFPWFGGLDGGSLEGAAYYGSTEMISSLQTHDVLTGACGLDFAGGNPWYRGNAYYLIYSLPPGGLYSRFGDIGPAGRKAVPDARYRLAASRMATLHRDGHLADYANRITGDPRPADPLLTFLWSASESVRPLPLETLPAARVFRDIGVVSMHSALTRPDENVRLEFRSSPYGGTGHAHCDQNSFNLIAYNEPLIEDSGYYTNYDRHHLGWTQQTKAHNTILVDGKGQHRIGGVRTGLRAYGRIIHFEQNDRWVYTVGDAAAAYVDTPLDRFDRHIVWLRGPDVQSYVIMDDLSARDGRPHRFSWLLHAVEKMTVDTDSGRVVVRHGRAEATASIVEPRTVEIFQTDQFDPPVKDGSPPRFTADQIRNQWHLTVTPPAARAQRFVVVLQVAPPETKLPRIQRLDSGVQVGSWKVRLQGPRASIEPAGPG